VSAVIDGFTEVSCQGIVNVRGETANIPVILLKDERERTMAVPIGWLEAGLMRRVLKANSGLLQPYRSLLACLDKLGVELKAVYILHSSDFDLPTRLILRPESGQDIEVDVSCSEGIACARIAAVPIYVAEQLMSAISTHITETSF